MELLKKSDQLSGQFRDEGNQKFKESAFECSLILFNKALSYAESKKNQALAYANRSAAYMELKKYDEAMMNIQLARENDYPAEKIQKLNEREEKCKKMMEEHVADPENDPWNFFKLSYPANPKIPFIINGLEVKISAKFGRGVYATRNLNPGDIIAVEEAQIRMMLEVPDRGYVYCCNCVKSNMLNLIPCTKSASLMFCSVSCREIAYKRMPTLSNIFTKPGTDNFDKLYADIEEILGDRDEVLKFIKEFDYKNSKVTIFDFDLSDPSHPDYRKNLLKCFLTFTNINDTVDQECLRILKLQFKQPDLKFELATTESKVIVDFIKNISGIFVMNAITLDHAAISTTFGGLLNHSCIPNIDRVQVANKTAYYILRPVKAGEQLFESYAADNISEIANYFHMIKERRSLFTSSMYGFNCNCPACKRDLNISNLLSFDDVLVDNLAHDLHLAMQHSMKKTTEHLKKCWMYVSVHHKNLQSGSVPLLIYMNKTMIWEIGRAASFPTFGSALKLGDFNLGERLVESEGV